jgi:hypothetical protein
MVDDLDVGVCSINGGQEEENSCDCGEWKVIVEGLVRLMASGFGSESLIKFK